MRPEAGQADLDPARLAQAARREAGAPPTTQLRFLDGLEILAAALDSEAGLTAAGRQRATSALVSSLVSQIHVDRLVATVPQAEQGAVRPVFITGLLRTGTTFLQHLLAHHPDLWSPALWELMTPADPRPDGERIAACADYVADYYRIAPDFRGIHLLEPGLPEECHRLTANSFRHPIYGLRYRIPSYSAWLDTQPMTAAYLYHRTQLRCLLHRRPGGVAVLKCPSHLWYPDALAAAYPNARVVRLHRSPAVSVPSVCSLTAVVRAARAGRVDPHEIGRYWLTRAESALAGTRRGVAPATGEAPLDIRYTDLVADPLATAERVCDHIGVPLTARARAAMTAFIAAQERPARGGHRYSAEEFGLTRRGLERRFADYIEEFRL